MKLECSGSHKWDVLNSSLVRLQQDFENTNLFKHVESQFAKQTTLLLTSSSKSKPIRTRKIDIWSCPMDHVPSLFSTISWTWNVPCPMSPPQSQWFVRGSSLPTLGSQGTPFLRVSLQKQTSVWLMFEILRIFQLGCFNVICQLRFFSLLYIYIFNIQFLNLTLGILTFALDSWLWKKTTVFGMNSFIWINLPLEKAGGPDWSWVD